MRGSGMRNPPNPEIHVLIVLQVFQSFVPDLSWEQIKVLGEVFNIVDDGLLSWVHCVSCDGGLESFLLISRLLYACMGM